MKLALYNSAEGSTDLEDPDVTTSSAPLDHQSTPPDFLGQVADFMRDHMVLVLVAASLVLISLLAVCGAVFLTRRRKFNVYYPSSYPAKMYVDQQDKSGGARGFQEISENKTASESNQESHLTDTNKQLQADIMRVAKNLRTPTKTLENASKKETLDKSPPSAIVEKGDEVSGPSPGSAAAENPQDESQEISTIRNLRPPSLHLHNDSATLQLIAGEKTAF
ncbi:transmembrane protein 119b [Hippocampus zosterae]|uniref:transmembrane protein 119b n=1 Tax=Hippocampus zosterae TaxID=109293 RepID=UPI00223D6DD7|nr:transmembrane protein 119b [Hippocampus zosterae]